MKLQTRSFLFLLSESPLAEGRELKCCLREGKENENPSPLAEGRGLKFDAHPFAVSKTLSPLAEGRELKLKAYYDSVKMVDVAPHGGV